MPARKQVEALEHICFMEVARTIHDISVQLEQEKSCKFSAEDLSSVVSSLPGVIIENMIARVIETIRKNFSRNRKTAGMKTCLEVLLQPHIQRLNLNGLFFKMRLQGTINSTIRNIVCSHVASMRNLTTLNMVSKCSDEILCVLSEKCPEISEVNISLSDLVTDKGLKALAEGCPRLEHLDIYKCWVITAEGIAYVLKCSKNLKKMQCDQLGSVLISEFSNTKKVFKLTHFEQTHMLFEPSIENVRWLGEVCPNLESASLYMADRSLAFLPQLGRIRVLELETKAGLGEGFIKAMKHLGSTLRTLHLNCNLIQQKLIMMLGECCPHLTTLHISTVVIVGDEPLANPGHLFSDLKVLHLQVWVWEESGLSNRIVDFFLMWCHKLESLLLKTEVGFLTDHYLDSILAVNPLKEAKSIIIASDEFVPLTLNSVNKLISLCPTLENLGISSWDIDEEEFFTLREMFKISNYNLTIS